MKRFQLLEESCNIPDTFLSGAPENRMLPRIRNFKRFLWRKADQPVVARQPVFGKHADIHVNAKRCTGYADRIGPVLQDVRHVHLFFFAR